ncbi:hypothetical protein J5N97_022065 [Dioscorea zingiberensis]|uniref:RIN4 pathogenic type III effector avirulence factor Avr cleavage site domain-containing protein n=1 Tax=Dioscorea zingiberensis TaxID=325984 RepID=A0A9D5CAG7_9LILI|nr:hypothetical protein J5N97_022065 [Dioscorea zingiberensis]
MAQKTHVPKFGNWESDDIVPYTQCFDNARIGKIGGKFNPNDPYENPDIFKGASPVQIPATKTRLKVEDPKSKNWTLPASAQHIKYKSELEDQKTKDWQYRDRGNSNNHRPPSHHDFRPQKPASHPFQRRCEDRKSGDHLQKPSRTSGGYDFGVDPSTFQHQHQGKSGNKGGLSSSSSWEKSSSGEASRGFASNTPSMSKMWPVGRGNETNGKTSTLPKFGEWDECDPSSAEGYSQIFNKMKEEKQRQTTTAKVPVISHDPIDTDHSKKNANPKSMRCGCFGICTK